jgi:hypothetical protein
MPSQFEQNEVLPCTTHSDYGVELMLYENFADASMLKWQGIFAKKLGGAPMRPIVEHHHTGLWVDLEGALYLRDASAFQEDIGVAASKCGNSVARIRAYMKTDLKDQPIFWQA